MQKIKFKNREIYGDRELIDHFLNDIASKPWKRGTYSVTESEMSELKTITVTLRLSSEEEAAENENNPQQNS